MTSQISACLIFHTGNEHALSSSGFPTTGVPLGALYTSCLLCPWCEAIALSVMVQVEDFSAGHPRWSVSGHVRRAQLHRCWRGQRCGPPLSRMGPVGLRHLESQINGKLGQKCSALHAFMSQSGVVLRVVGSKSSLSFLPTREAEAVGSVQRGCTSALHDSDGQTTICRSGGPTLECRECSLGRSGYRLGCR